MGIGFEMDYERKMILRTTFFKVRRTREQHTSKDGMKSRSRENPDKSDGFWAMLLSSIKKSIQTEYVTLGRKWDSTIRGINDKK